MLTTECDPSLPPAMPAGPAALISTLVNIWHAAETIGIMFIAVVLCSARVKVEGLVNRAAAVLRRPGEG
jgi:hypothetical protein